MREKVKITEYDDRVFEWEAGLPNLNDLTPLSQFLIPSELASAFSIKPEPYRNMIDVDRASQNTLSGLRLQSQQHHLNEHNDFKSVSDEMVVEGEQNADLTRDGSDSQKLRRVDSGGANSGADDSSGTTLKRHRLIWTPQLHKRFIEVVAHLGMKKAVPKTIMQLMNVEGLTRENVASHLQKYRIYLNRIQGLSDEGPSSSDHLFASTPVPQSLHESAGKGNSHSPMPIPVPYPPQMVPNPIGGGGGAYLHRFESNSHPYNMMMQQRDWCGSKFGSVSPYHHR